VLPARDEALARAERRLTAELAEVTPPAHRRLLSAYTTWRVDDVDRSAATDRHEIRFQIGIPAADGHPQQRMREQARPAGPAPCPPPTAWTSRVRDPACPRSVPAVRSAPRSA
jgi:hypothetical protein